MRHFGELPAENSKMSTENTILNYSNENFPLIRKTRRRFVFDLIILIVYLCAIVFGGDRIKTIDVRLSRFQSIYLGWVPGRIVAESIGPGVCLGFRLDRSGSATGSGHLVHKNRYAGFEMRILLLISNAGPTNYGWNAEFVIPFWFVSTALFAFVTRKGLVLLRASSKI